MALDSGVVVIMLLFRLEILTGAPTQLLLPVYWKS